MNIAPIQLPPHTPAPTVNTLNPVCPKAPQKSPNLNWGHAINPQVCRKLFNDKEFNDKEFNDKEFNDKDKKGIRLNENSPKNDFSSKKK